MALLALAPACGFRSSADGGTGGAIDAGPVCFGATVPICFPASAVPAAQRTLGAFQINTDLTGSGSLCDQHNDQQARYCVVPGAGLTLPAGLTLTAQGDKPLVLLSTGAVELAGNIDVSSHQTGGQLRGAGASPMDPAACAFAMPATAATMGGGGAGASLGTEGGGGGSQTTSGSGGGAPGSKLDGVPSALHGGCKGGDGAANAGSPAAGGDGGGAVAVIAVQQIHVEGATINASGGAAAAGRRARSTAAAAAAPAG